MPITKKSGRQETITAIVPFTFADLVGLSGVYAPAVDLPQNAIPLSARIHMDTAFNSATSDTFSIGDKVGSAAATATTYSAAAAIAAGAVQFGNNKSPKYAALSTIGLVWTGVGAIPTAGAGRLVVEYAVEGRTGFSQG